MTRKRDLGVKQTQINGKTHELPVTLYTLEQLVIKPEDWRLLKRHSLAMINLISDVAAQLGMFRVETEDEHYIAWDVPDRKAPTPLGESKIKVVYKALKPIPGIPSRHSLGHGAADYFVDPTYKIDDA